MTGSGEVTIRRTIVLVLAAPGTPVINEEGTVHQDGDQLIMEFETQDQDHCRHKERGPALTVRYQITCPRFTFQAVRGADRVSVTR